MVKRGRLEIIYDILNFIQKEYGEIKYTPLLRKSNLSSSRFKDYFSELIRKDFVKVNINKNQKLVIITNKGKRFLEKYQSISNFIEEFEL